MVTNNSANIPTAASGKILQGAGIGSPSVFSTATYPSTATGTSKVLIADGTNWVASTPTFPNASATSGKIIKSDGTNWTASTETYAAPSTSGNVMTSDGTNWTSAAVSGPGGLSYTTVTLTSAQIKALHATPIQIIAAQGAGKVVVVISAWAKLIYGGTNVFTAGASQFISVYYGTAVNIMNTTGVAINSLITNNATSYSSGILVNLTTAGVSFYENVAINCYNASATEITGNAANNNTITITALYYVINI
jgi:hypothetical protein